MNLRQPRIRQPDKSAHDRFRRAQLLTFSLLMAAFALCVACTATPMATTVPNPAVELETPSNTASPANHSGTTRIDEVQEQTFIPSPTSTTVYVPTPTLPPKESYALQLANEQIRQWAVEKIRPAVVFLGDANSSASTGFIYRTEGEIGYILTDAKRVENLDRIPVIIHGGTRLVGDVHSKWNSPLAVVQVCCKQFHSVEFADDEIPQSGDELTILGFNGGPEESADQNTTTVTRVQHINHLDRGYRVLKTDHIPNHVQAGSPLFDDNWRVAGILAQLGTPGDAIAADSIVEVLPFLESLEPRWQPAPKARWSAGEMRRRLIHLEVPFEGRYYKIGNGFVYKTAGGSAYIAASFTTTSPLATEDIGKIQVVTYDGLRMEGDLFWDEEPVALIRACCADFKPLEFSEDRVLEVDDHLIALGHATGQDSPVSYVESNVTTVSVKDGHSLATLDILLSRIEYPSFGQPLFDEEGKVSGILTSNGLPEYERVLSVDSTAEILSRLELSAQNWRPENTASPAMQEAGTRLRHYGWSAAQARPGIVHVGESLNKIGAGFIYRTEGETAYIVTHSERVGYRDKVPVITYHGRRIEADILWQPDTTLVVLRACCGDFQSLQFSEDGTLEVGDQVTALGHPLGPENPASYVRANIKETDVNYDGHQIADTDRALRAPSAYWGGSWLGTPAFNDHGHVVGIVIGHRDGQDTVMSAGSVREILPHLEAMQPNWQPNRITVANPY